MSRENEEILRRAGEAWERRDLDALAGDFHPDAVTYRAHPDGATFYGPDGFLQAITEWFSEFKDFEATPEEITELEDGRLLVRVRETGVGERSGAPIAADFWFAYTFSGSKIVRLGMFPSKEQALEDAATGRGTTADANLQTVGRWFEALSGEDFDAAIALMHSEAELVPPGGQPAYRGIESLRRWMEPDALRNQVAELLSTEAAEDGTVLARHRLTARGASSGFELDVVSWSVWGFDADGLITRAEIFLDREEDKAREAAGL